MLSILPTGSHACSLISFNKERAKCKSSTPHSCRGAFSAWCWQVNMVNINSLRGGVGGFEACGDVAAEAYQGWLSRRLILSHRLAREKTLVLMCCGLTKDDSGKSGRNTYVASQKIPTDTPLFSLRTKFHVDDRKCFCSSCLVLAFASCICRILATVWIYVLAN